jgi:uncharacterized protein YecE (DUF72 family)
VGVAVQSRTSSNTPSSVAVLHVGTSGYSYPEWVEAGFYPPGTSQRQMLKLYTERFSCTELNYTWYQMPKAEAVERQRKQAPPGFLFAAKLTRTLTHEVDENWRAHATQYRDGIAPLQQARQLAAVLLQWPASFDRSMANRKYLATLLDELGGLPLAVEFRNDSWVNDRVFAELERRKVTLVAVDEPQLKGLFPPLAVATNPAQFYVRFHGRNASGWRSGQMQSKFDYSYSDAELRDRIAQTIDPLAQKAQQGLLFFNNHVRAQAPKNAKTLIQLLLERGMKAA